MNKIWSVAVIIFGCGMGIIKINAANHESSIKVWLVGKKSPTVEQAYVQRNWYAKMTAVSVGALTAPLAYHYFFSDHNLSPKEKKKLYKASAGLAVPIVRLGYAQWDLMALQKQRDEADREALRQHLNSKNPEHTADY